MIREELDTIAFEAEFKAKYPDKPITFENNKKILIDHSGKGIPKELDDLVYGLITKHTISKPDYGDINKDSERIEFIAKKLGL